MSTLATLSDSEILRLLGIADRQVSAAQAEKYWRAGVLAWKLDRLQREVYEWWWALQHEDPSALLDPVIVAMIARRCGKTFTFACIAIEIALQTPGSLQHYVTQTGKAAKEILLPAFRTIFADCPRDLRPEWKSIEGKYIFPNGSEILVGGAEDIRKCDKFRGPFTDCAWVDEAGYIDPLDYLVQSVLVPMTHNRPGARVTCYSNSPRSAAHAVVPMISAARVSGNYFHATVEDSPRYTRRQIDSFVRKAGGRNSSTALREYYCVIVPDGSRALVPEFSPRALEPWVLEEALVPDVLDPSVQVKDWVARPAGPTDVDAQAPLVREVERPRWYDPWVSIDPGFSDLTAVIFGYWHFDLGILVIEDELEFYKTIPEDVAAAVKAKEAELWAGREDTGAPIRRVQDVDPSCQEVFRRAGVPTTQANNQDREGRVNAVRTLCAEGKLAIHPRCVKLIDHLEAGLWNRTRSDFDRPAATKVEGVPYRGHMDFVAAMTFIVKSVKRHRNPRPPLLPEHSNPLTHHIGPHTERARRTGLEDLADSMRGRRKSPGRR